MRGGEGEGKGGVKGLALSWSKIKKLKFASSFTSPDFFFKKNFCYEVIVKQKIHKRASNYYYYMSKRALLSAAAPDVCVYYCSMSKRDLLYG